MCPEVTKMATAIRIPSPTRRPASSSRRFSTLGRLAMVLEIFLGIGALFGGIQFILAPDGHLLGVPLSMLAGTPFHSFLVPGLLLFTFVGLAPIMAVPHPTPPPASGAPPAAPGGVAA